MNVDLSTVKINITEDEYCMVEFFGLSLYKSVVFTTEYIQVNNFILNFRMNQDNVSLEMKNHLYIQMGQDLSLRIWHCCVQEIFRKGKVTKMMKFRLVLLL